MPEWTRDEERSYAFWWFVAASSFAAVSVLAVWDDGVRRAPWKRDQNAFFEIERDLAAKNLASQRRRFAKESRARFRALGRELEDLRERKGRADFRRWEAQLARLDEEYGTVEEDFTFATSDRDEAYYYRTVAEYQVELAPPEQRASKRAIVDALLSREAGHQRRMEDAARRMRRIDDRRRPLRERLAPTTDRIAAIERERTVLRHDLDEAQRRSDAARGLTHEILQTVFRWRIDKTGAFVEDVDRCHTCHRGIDSGLYEDPRLPVEFRTHPNRQYLLATHPVDRFGCTPCHLGQGRAIDFPFAHSRRPPVLGREGGALRVGWEREGDHYWEEPMLSVGALWRQSIDADSKDFTVTIDGNETALSLDEKTYSDVHALMSALQRKVQAALPAPEADAPFRDRFRVYLEGSHVAVQLLREMTNPGADPVAPPAFSIAWTDPTLGRILGFDGPVPVTTRYVAPLSPEPTIRSRGNRGTDGLQVPGGERERLIVSAPFVESGCLRCHRDDVDLRPFRSVAQMVVKADEAALALARETAQRNGEPAPQPPPEPEDPDRLPDLAPTLSEGRFLFRSLNCTGCHTLDGFPGNRNAGPTLDDIASKVSPEWLVAWLRYPRAWRPGTRMPNIWPIPIDPDTKAVVAPGSEKYLAWERERDTEITAIAAYLLEKSTRRFDPGAPVPAASAEEGRRLFETVGCRGCHSVTAPSLRVGAFAARERDRAPNLYGIGDKVDAQWLTAWIENPAALWPGTRMPNLRLTREQAASVAAYLATLRDPAARFPEIPEALRTSEGRAPLVEEGGRLVASHGCFGCHQIAGYEDRAPIAPDLGGLARKDVTTLDFGYAVPDHHEHTWETFVAWKLDAPRIYERDRIRLLMGDFDLSPHEIRSLLVFLKGTQDDVVSAQYRPSSNPRISQIEEGRQIVDDFNCRGCHVIEGHGGDIRTYYGNEPEQLAKAPPLLRAQGLRVQPEWLFSYLRQPTPIRLWLDVRMPTFNLTNEQATAIVAYFSAWDGQPFPFQRQARVTPPAEELMRIDGLVTLLQCATTCHLPPDQVPAGTATAQLAPDLSLTRERLRPDWLVRWLENPERLMPGTQMPAFFAEPFGPSPYEGIYPGDSQQTMRALRDYLLNLDVVNALKTGARAPGARSGAAGGPARPAPPGRTARPPG